MDWLSFAIGFLTFPLAAGAALLGYRALLILFSHRERTLGDLGSSSKTLTFAPRLIGKIRRPIEIQPEEGPVKAEAS